MTTKTMRRSNLFLAILALTAISGSAVGAQPPALTAETRTAVVHQVAAALRDRYVFPDVGEATAAKIEAQLKSGAYDGLTEPGAFAKQLTDDMAIMAHDKHLRVAALNVLPQSATGPRPPSMPKAEAGVVRADRLDGEIGYIEIIGFPPPATFKPVLDRAMAALADTKALIIDDRRNGGGSPDAVAYLVSFFVPNDKPVPINTFYSRTPATQTFVSRVETTTPTPTKYLGKSVYLLTSGTTFSGGEEIAYDLQTMKIATTVGQITGGGANPGGGVPLSSGFSVFMPMGRPESAITHTNWEGKGVAPDIAVPADDALRTALQHLGQTPTAADVESLSRASLFEIRKTPLPGTEFAVRQVVADLAQGTPHYDAMTQDMVDVTRSQLPQLKDAVGRLGELKSVAFTGPGGVGDSYAFTFANGSLNVSVAVNPDGKIEAVGFSPS
jgi:hypothetical protein